MAMSKIEILDRRRFPVMGVVLKIGYQVDFINKW